MAAAILALLNVIVPLAIRIVGMYLDKSAADNETKRKFIDFVEHVAKQSNRSASLKASAEAQLERLKKFEENNVKPSN